MQSSMRPLNTSGPARLSANTSQALLLSSCLFRALKRATQCAATRTPNFRYTSFRNSDKFSATLLLLKSCPPETKKVSWPRTSFAKETND